MTKWLCGALMALAASASLPAMASATVIVDTGAPPGLSAPPGPLFNTGTFAGASAAQFHLDSAAVLTDVEGWIQGGGTFQVVIYAQSLDLPERPGAFQYLGHASSPGGVPAWQGVHGVSWALGPGDWWVAFQVGIDDTFSIGGNMPGGAPNPLPLEAVFISGQPDWSRADDLDIGVRISGTVVPEPATWALMIGGFGLAGVALRRRRYA